jgi:hypothetical protein
MTNPPASTSQNTGTSRQKKSTWIIVLVVGVVVTLLGYAGFYTYLVETDHPEAASALFQFPANTARSVALPICAGNPWCSMEQVKQGASLSDPLSSSPGRTKRGPIKKRHRKSINAP